MDWRSLLPRWSKHRNDAEQRAGRWPENSEIQQEVASALIRDLITERRANRRWTFAKRAALALMFVAGIAGYAYYYAKFNGWSLIPSSDLLGVVRVTGEINSNSLARADKVVPALTKAFQTDNVKAVAIMIDSPGGAPVEAERIVNALTHLREKHPKPVYAVVGSLGASAGYMVAMHADTIYAGRYSLVGSIGAVMSSWDVHKALARFEIYQRVFASGELKAMLNPYTEQSPEGIAKAEALVGTVGQRFQEDLSAARGSRLVTTQHFGSGELWDGETAKALGLVDELGTLETLQARLDAEYGDLKVHEFGPGAPSQLPFAATVGEWLESTIANALSAVTRGPSLR